MKNSLELLMEACQTECDCDDVERVEAEEELLDQYDDIEEFDDELGYTEEMVNIITDDNDRHIIEADDLAKYMSRKGIIEVEEAVDNIIAHYAKNDYVLEKSNIAILIESDDVVEELIEEAKKSKSAVKKMDATAKFVKTLKGKNLGVIKKKSKKK